MEKNKKDKMNFIPKAYIAVAPRFVYESVIDRNDYIIDVMKQAYPKNESLNFVKNNLKNKYCLYSDESIGNMEEFTRFINDVGDNDIYLKYYDHFDGYHRIYKIPELNDIINKLL